MASWTQQALLEAPVEEVWKLLEDIARYPQWNEDTISVTGAPTEIEMGTHFELTGRGPFGLKATTTFRVEKLDELRELKLRCETSGLYSRWVLTEAQHETFTEVEMGVEKVAGATGAVTGALHTKRYLRRATEDTLDNLRRALGRQAAERK